MTATTATILSFSNVDHDAAELVANTVNRAHAEGRTVEVNGRKVKNPQWTRKVATVWQNGTVEFDVEPRNGRTHSTGSVYVKEGQSASITIA